jgi:hypothetical protein
VSPLSSSARRRAIRSNSTIREFAVGRAADRLAD